jgi:hypothetical protein
MTQGRGEHASRRFHFVREEHTDPLLACKRNAGQPALSACESDFLMPLTRREDVRSVLVAELYQDERRGCTDAFPNQAAMRH